MHNAVRKFVKYCKEEYPSIALAKKIIECGSKDINGSAREYFTEAEEHVGIDWRDGDGVDVVSLCHEYDGKPDGYFDLGICFEMFEHDPHWKKSLKKLLSKISLEGSLIISCAGPRRHHHQFQSAPEKNYYKNLNIDQLKEEIVKGATFKKIDARYSSKKHDIYIACIEKTRHEGYPMEHLFLHLIKERDFKKVVELGVFSGNLVNRICSQVDLVKYYAVDPWKVYVESYDRQPHEHERDQSYWDGLYERVLAMKEKYPVLQIMRMTSVKAAQQILQSESFVDCVYIDTIHDEKNVVKDVFAWITLIRNGGVLCGHDYTKRFEGMAKALDNIFGDDLNLMIIDPSKPALTYKNTHQGGNWWVDVEVEKYGKWIGKIEELYSEIIAEVEAEWKSA